MTTDTLKPLKPGHFRVTMDLPPESKARLDAMVQKCKADSPVEVFCNAMQLYEALVAEAEGGATFLIRKNGAVTEYEIFK